MSSTWSFHGGFSWWIHEEDFACSQTGLIDFSNLFFASLVFLTLLFSSIRRNSIISCTHSDFINLSVSICCVLTGVLYIGVGSWDSIAKNHENPDFKIPISCFIRGFIWIILGLSLIVKLPKWIKSLVSVWWVLFFVISSCINVEILSRNREIGAMVLIPWIANSFLFFCAMRNFSGFFSCLAFSWMNPLLSLGYSKPLILEDIPSLESEDESNSSFEKFIGEWELNRREKGSSNRNLVFWTLFKIYWKEMVIVGLLTTVRTMSVAVSPLLLYLFVNHFDNEAENTKQGLILVGFLVVAKVFESLSYRQFFFVSRKIGLRMRSALMVAVYKKQLDLSNSGKMRNSTGEIVNYIAIDAYRMGEFPMWFHSLWSYILQLFLVIFVLFEVVGLGVVPGLFPLFLFAVLNIPFAKSLQKCQSELMVAQDRRLRSTSEILNSMKIIKLQSWEENCKRLIDTLRETEFKWLAEAQYKKIYNTALYWISPTIISSVIFFGCVFFSTGSLDAGTVFTVLAALRGMSEPVRMIPEALSALIQVNVSLDRINSFLLEDELKKEPKRGHFSCDSEHQIQIKSGCFSWNPESAIPTLRNVNLEAKKGEKIAVCGPVGAGKSSLLYSILGEIPRISGTVDVCGLIAYVSQASWIQSGTIRENILFGKPMDQTKYENAIKSCALDKDLDGFEYGDLTEIGERGLNMSGGQKQRIQLARALYNDADIYLLDDPFSAVDAHTAVTLFNDCVMGALAKKTVVLVTHQVEFLSKADKIMVMDCGQVTQSGNYEELLMEETAFEKLVVAHNNSLTTLNPSIDDKGGETRRKNAFKLEENNESNYIRKESNEGEILVKGAFGVQLTEEEERGIGEVGWKPFLDYILVPKGPFFLCSNIVTQSGFVVLQAAASYWLAYGVQDPKISSFVLIGVYTLVSGLSAIFVFSRSFFAAVLGLSASKSFFFRFNDAIFNAPMLFFDSTPVGRILTRASSDMSVLDFDIPFSIAFVLAAGIELIATIGIMASATWQVLIVGVFATLASKYVQGYYQASARELMRINGTTKAPIMNYAAETSLGVATIRAFDMSERFFNNYLKLVDSDAKTIFFSNAAMEWLILRTETLQNLTLFTAALLLVLLPKGYISPGIVGLSLSYALALTNTQVFLSRWYSSLSNYIISVERIKQFMNIPPEPPGIIKDNRPPSKWPSMGRIELQDLKIRYRSNFPLVLKGITCTFREGDRVGIVGRTGSGKTTLISALFRLVEPNGGRIIIDGIDICSIGLKDLRMKLSIIPQEPTLFKGSVRTNLDPLGLYSDDEIWKALELCQLKVTISSLPNLLDSSVSDEGENWSMGQRQLFCLGRVLLKRNKILVLDEATASIDSATDAILQRIIREQFSNCTVITVAHRVPTVIDSDMVMVLSYGKMVEYDEPSKLMEMSSSSFSKLVAEYWSSCTREDST